jgi:hypothetical protein
MFRLEERSTPDSSVPWPDLAQLEEELEEVLESVLEEVQLKDVLEEVLEEVLEGVLGEALGEVLEGALREGVEEGPEKVHLREGEERKQGEFCLFKEETNTPSLTPCRSHGQQT